MHMMKEDTDSVPADTDGPALRALSDAINFEGFWRSGYDLKDPKMVVELITIMMDFGVYEKFQKVFHFDLLQNDWGYFIVRIQMPDETLITGWRTETHNKKLWNIRQFLKKTMDAGGHLYEKKVYKTLQPTEIIPSIELCKDRITRAESSAYNRSRFTSFRWMKDHPDMVHMIKSHLK